MHAVIQAPLALIGQSILAAINQVAQPYAGERKSAVDTWALAQVRERQRTLMTKYRADRDEYEQAALLYEVSAKRVIGDKKLSPEGRKASRCAGRSFDDGDSDPIATARRTQVGAGGERRGGNGRSAAALCADADGAVGGVSLAAAAG